MRYFYVSYSADGAIGACTVTATKFINHRCCKEGIKKAQPSIVNPFILSWNEMTEEEYLIFTEE